MHEVSIIQSLFETAIEQLQQAGGTNIHTLRVQVGLLSGVIPEALEFAFDGLKSGTPAESATLWIERIPATFSCSECGLVILVESFHFICPSCQSQMAVHKGGKELQLVEMDIS